jgi:hypothetical protein
MFPFRSFYGEESIAMPIMWKIRARLFLGVAETWVRNLFLTAHERAERYHQAVAEEAFETWMNCGDGFDRAIQDRIDAADARQAHQSVRFWQDVLVSARDFDSYPENRRMRGTPMDRAEAEAVA